MHRPIFNKRFRSVSNFSGLAMAIIASLSLVSSASAQSGTRATPQSGKAAGSGTSSQQGSVGLQGYCPVCIVEMKKWMKGSPQFSTRHDGKTYLFPGEEQRQMFLKNPQKYTPVLGGDCVVIPHSIDQLPLFGANEHDLRETFGSRFGW